jgi:low affinity Fe/Cu permease
MSKQAIDAQDRTVHGHFGRFSAAASGWLGSTWAFAGAGLVVVVWATTGPLFHYSGNWVVVIGTGTSIATFLMVFLIQNTQNRDARAIQKLSDLELDAMQATYEKIKTSWTERQSRSPRGAQEK